MPDEVHSGDLMEALYALQTLDVALDRLREERESSPLIGELEKARSLLEALRSRRDQAKAREGELKKSLRRLEHDLDSTVGEIAAVEAKLFSGNVRSAKELSSLQERLEGLKRQRELLEEDVLAHMEAVESAEEATKAAEHHVVRAEEAEATSRTALEEAQAVWKAEAQRLAKERSATASSIDPSRLERYESLRRRMRRPVAKVENRTCSGCHVAFPTGMKAPNAGELSQCPHCDRLLWWPAKR